MLREHNKDTFGFILILFLAAFAYGQEYEQWRYWNNGTGVQQTWIFGDLPEAVATEVKNRWAEIGDSLKTSTNKFSGTYYQSGNRGYYLRWSPEKGFVYVRYYEYFVEDTSYGEATVTNSGVHFTIKREMQRTVGGRKFETPSDWFPALNGKYFVQRNELPMFADFYGGFGDFNGFPRKWDCDCDPFAERTSSERGGNNEINFIVPAPLLPFIKTPIVGKIIRVGKRYYGKHLFPYVLDEVERKASLTTVTINIGKLNGVTAGLIFLLSPDIDSVNEMLVVTKAGINDSTAVVIRSTDRTGREAFVDKYDDVGKPIHKNYQPIRPGIVIRTRDIESL